MNKHLISTFALAAIFSLGTASASLAQSASSKSDSDKMKTKEDGMTSKTKVGDDGKMKMKGKADDGSKMKAKTKPMGNGMAMNSSDGVMVGGAMMVASKDIVDNAVNSTDHTTLVSAVKAAGLVETLKGAGPFTVFARKQGQAHHHPNLPRGARPLHGRRPQGRADADHGGRRNPDGNEER
jgi:hypothetical protein